MRNTEEFNPLKHRREFMEICRAVCDASRFIENKIQESPQLLEDVEHINEFFGFIMESDVPYKIKIGVLSVLCAGRYIHIGNKHYRFDEALPEASILIYDQIEQAYREKLPLKIKLYTWHYYTRWSGLRPHERYEIHTVEPTHH